VPFASAPRINRAARNGQKSVRGDRLHDGSRAAVGNESVPIQLAQFRFPGLAIFTLKYKYIFQIKYTEAILSNSTPRKLLWVEISKMLIAV